MRNLNWNMERLLKKKSRDEAAFWIQKAADQGLGEAWFWLYYADLGKEQPVFYLKKAADKGYSKAFDYLFDKLLFRAGSSANVEEAKKYAVLARKLNITFDYFDSAAEQRTIDRCYEAGSADIPASDRPTDKEIDTFTNSKIACWSYQTGIGARQDWSNYRKYVLSRIHNPHSSDNNDAERSYDNNDLAEIYANGWGVKRNVKLAMALVCHGSDVPAELIAMIEALYSTKDKGRLQPEFLFCDNITSGAKGGFCSARAEQIANKQREQEAAGIILHWTELQQEHFRALQEAAESYFSEHAGSEQDMSGSARNSFFIDEEEKLRDEFLISIKLFEAGQIPADIDFVKADRDLNNLYSQILTMKFEEYPGAVTKNGIRSTQRKWIKYRDAWVKFAEVKYPARSPDLWKTWATKQRSKQLEELSKEQLPEQ